MAFPKDLLSKSKQRLDPPPPPTVQDLLGARVPEISEAQKGGILALAGDAHRQAQENESWHAAKVERETAERKAADDAWQQKSRKDYTWPQ